MQSHRIWFIFHRSAVAVAIVVNRYYFLRTKLIWNDEFQMHTCSSSKWAVPCTTTIAITNSLQADMPEYHHIWLWVYTKLWINGRAMKNAPFSYTFSVRVYNCACINDMQWNMHTHTQKYTWHVWRACDRVLLLLLVAVPSPLRY